MSDSRFPNNHVVTVRSGPAPADKECGLEGGLRPPHVYILSLNNKTLCMYDGGEGGIRTPGTLASTPHFECGAIDHSATSPEAVAPNGEVRLVASLFGRRKRVSPQRAK